MMTAMAANRPVDTPANVLYSFSNFLFTSANTSGNTGPNLSTATSYYTGNSFYNGNTWINNSSYYNVTNGIQYWTVPVSGQYTITAAGASGGLDVGLGARLTSTVSLTGGEIIRIAVGQRGGNVNTFYGSGGGGTFVVRTPFNTNASIIMIAGGGGGKNSTGSTVNSGGQSGLAPGQVDSGVVATWGGGGGSSGANGGLNGAAGGNQATGGYPGGGGGFFGNGGYSGGGLVQVGGRSWVFGANGGPGYTGSESPGGFGGGGGGTARGAGGGGYNGGGAALNGSSGGGGGSYNTGSSMSNVANVNLGHGYVQITYAG